MLIHPTAIILGRGNDSMGINDSRESSRDTTQLPNLLFDCTTHVTHIYLLLFYESLVLVLVQIQIILVYKRRIKVSAIKDTCKIFSSSVKC